MAEKYQESRRGAGWVWAIVGVIVAVLVVWWVAAAVTDKPEQYSSAPVETASETPRAEREGQAEAASSVDEDLAPPKISESGQLEASLQRLNEWVAQQGEIGMDADTLDEGAARLSGAAGELVMGLYAEMPEEGAQMGGGPADELSASIYARRDRLESSLEQLKDASSDAYPEAFHEVAQDFVALVDGVQDETSLEEVASEPLAQLHDSLEDLSPTSPLDEQEVALKTFFNSGAAVLNKYAENLNTSAAE